MTKTIESPVSGKPKPVRTTARRKPARPVKNAASRAQPLAEPRAVVKRPAPSREQMPKPEIDVPGPRPGPAELAVPAVQPADAAPPRPKRTLTQVLLELSRRATTGDATSMKELMDLLNKRPDLWHAIGDVGAHVERTLIQFIAGDQVLQQESVRRTLSELKQRIAGEQPSALEKMLIDLIGATWLATNHAELTGSGNCTAVHDQYYLKRAESAQRRFTNAVKTLTTLRELAPRGLRPLPQPPEVVGPPKPSKRDPRRKPNRKPTLKTK